MPVDQPGFVRTREPIRRIVIVGGGTAGWMSAVVMAGVTRSIGTSISLIESSDIPTVGVGEASIPPLVAFLRGMDIDEDRFIRRCSATYKLGIEFVGWRGGNDSFWHPFGPCGGRIDDTQLFHHWLKARTDGVDVEPYNAYSLQYQLGVANKSPRPLVGQSPIVERGDYAYHLDAGAFADLLRELAVERGVNHVIDEVRDVRLDGTGRISSISTAGGGDVGADLYIDCTGFSGLLIGRCPDAPFIDWSDHLLCDRAVVANSPPLDPLPPYTRSTATDAGWVWRVPLSTRTGNGHVYATAFTDRDAAIRTLHEHVGGTPDVRELDMRVGRRARFWSGNCVAIGLSAGFVEPLESTGIYLIQKGIELLVEHFPDSSVDERLADEYNRDLGAVFEEVRDFLVLHYVCSARDDTPFWRANRAITPPDSLLDRLERYRATGVLDASSCALFKDPSWLSVLQGLDQLPERHAARTDLSDAQAVRGLMTGLLAQHARMVRSLPDHRGFIDHLTG